MLYLRCFVVLACCLAWSLGAGAMMLAVSDEELVGTSDMIVVGTVVDEVRQPQTGDWNDGQTTIKVERVLKGTADATLVFRHRMPPMPPQGMIIMDHGGFILAQNSRWLFYLQRYQYGYQITAGPMGRRAPDDVEKIAQMIAAFPVTVKLGTVSPLYFDRPTTVPVSMTNRGATVLQCSLVTLEGFYFSSRLGTQINFALKQAANIPAGENPQAVMLELGKTKDVTIVIAALKSQNWDFLTPETYLLTPVTVRARIFIAPPAQPVQHVGTGGNGYYAASAWVNTWVGFPPPGE